MTAQVLTMEDRPQSCVFKQPARQSFAMGAGSGFSGGGVGAAGLEAGLADGLVGAPAGGFGLAIAMTSENRDRRVQRPPAEALVEGARAAFVQAKQATGRALLAHCRDECR